MSTINYEQNKKYFRTTSYKPGIVLGVIGMFLLLTGKGGPVVIGLALVGLGGFLIYQQVSGRPADAEIDRQTEAVMSEIRQRALRKLGLDMDEVSLIDPIVVGGYFLGSLGTPNLVRQGKDGRFRSSSFEGVVIFFGEQELHAYKYQMSLIADENRVSTDVYFYRDVVSVSTNSSSSPVHVVGETKEKLWKTEVFTLTTSGATAVVCSMNTSDGAAERTIQGARQLVRNKKMLTP